MLFIVAPQSLAFQELSAVERSEYTVVESGDGLASANLGDVLGFIGKSVSKSRDKETRNQLRQSARCLARPAGDRAQTVVFVVRRLRPEQFTPQSAQAIPLGRTSCLRS